MPGQDTRTVPGGAKIKVAARHIVAANRVLKKKTDKDGSPSPSDPNGAPPTPKCPELNCAVVGSVCRGANRIWRDYTAGERLGAGAFSEVYKVQQKQGGRFFAAKKISKLNSNYHHQSLEREIKVMKEIDHPNCMRLVSVYDEPTACVLVLEMVKGSSMLARLIAMLRVHPGCFYAEPDAAKVLEGCLSGLRCIHSMNIAHLDLKPENIMFVTDDVNSEFHNVVKICDFGLARKVASAYDVMHTVCGTPGFMAPEMLAETGYTRQADMYSVGAIMHWMFSGRLPHNQDDSHIPEFLAMAAQNKLGLPPKQADKVSSNAQGLLGSMLDGDPSRRCTASVALDHPWIKYQGTSFCAAVCRNHWLNYTMRSSSIFDNFDGEEAERSLGLLTSMMERTTYEPGAPVQVDGSFEGLFFVESGTIALETRTPQEDDAEGSAGPGGSVRVSSFTAGSLLMPLSLFLPNREIDESQTRLAVPKERRLRFPANVYTTSAAAFRDVAGQHQGLSRRFAAIAAACVERELEKHVDGDGGSEAREAAQEEEAGGDKDEDEDELLHKIDMWYKLLDTDGNGAISFEELRDGIKKIPGAADVDLSRSEFDNMTEEGTHLDANGEIPRLAFQHVMRRGLERLAEGGKPGRFGRTSSAGKQGRFRRTSSAGKNGAQGSLRALLSAVNGHLAHDWRTRRCLANVHHYIARGVDMSLLPVVEAAEEEISGESCAALKGKSDDTRQDSSSGEAGVEAEALLRMGTVNRSMHIGAVASMLAEPGLTRRTSEHNALSFKTVARRVMFGSILSAGTPQTRSPHDNWVCTSCNKDSPHYLYSIYATGSNGEKLFQVRGECVHCKAKRPQCFCEACTNSFRASSKLLPAPARSECSLSVPTGGGSREEDSDEETDVGTLQNVEAFKTVILERSNYLKAQKAILWWSSGGLSRSFELWKHQATASKQRRADADVLNRAKRAEVGAARSSIVRDWDLQNLTPDVILSSTPIQQQEWAHAIPLTRADLGRLMRVVCRAILAVCRMRAILGRHRRSSYWKKVREELQAQRDDADGSKLRLEDVYTSQLGKDLFALDAISDGRANPVGVGLVPCMDTRMRDKRSGILKREADIVNSTTIKEHAGIEGGFLWVAATVQRHILRPDKRQQRSVRQVMISGEGVADSENFVRCRSRRLSQSEPSQDMEIRTPATPLSRRSSTMGTDSLDAEASFQKLFSGASNPSPPAIPGASMKKLGDSSMKNLFGSAPSPLRSKLGPDQPSPTDSSSTKHSSKMCVVC